MHNDKKHKIILDQIQEAYGLHRMIFDESGQAVDFTFLEVNKKFEEMTGFLFEEIKDKTIMEVAPKTDTSLIKSYHQLLKTGDPFFGRVFASQADKVFQVSAYRYGPDTFSAFFLDVTGQEKIKKDLFHAKEVAEAANKAKGHFLSNLSHEVRTPLNGIIGLSHISKKQLQNEKEEIDVDKITSNLEHIQKLSRDLLKVINDTLEYSDLELGRKELEENHLKIERILFEAVQYYQAEAKEKNIKIITKISDDFKDDYLGDEDKLLKIFYYLIGNGVRNTPFGDVQVSVFETADDALMIKVKGTGYQAGGLDLDIAAAFVAQMGGRLIFEPADETEGARTGISRTRLPLKRLATVIQKQLENQMLPESSLNPCGLGKQLQVILAERIEGFSEEIHQNIFIGQDTIEETLNLLDTCPDFKEEFIGITRSLDVFDYPEAQEKIRNLLKRMKPHE